MSSDYVEVVPEAAIAERVAQLGEEITADYAGKAPVVVGVLVGCFPFMADLLRHLPYECEPDFLMLTRFGEEGRVSIHMDTSSQLAGRDVLIVEDIVDTGLTLTTLRRMLEVRGPRSLRTVALLDKAPRRIVEVDVDYRGFEVGDEYLVGYGLDHENRYRNLRSLWAVMDIATLQEDPAGFEAIAYGVHETDRQ